MVLADVIVLVVVTLADEVVVEGADVGPCSNVRRESTDVVETAPARPTTDEEEVEGTVVVVPRAVDVVVVVVVVMAVAMVVAAVVAVDAARAPNEPLAPLKSSKLLFPMVSIHTLPVLLFGEEGDLIDGRRSSCE